MRSARRMPALFVGHGSPMNAIEDSAFRRGWQAIAHALPRPDTILCVSAHWETSDLRVTTSPWPGTIHDFFGFPAALSAVRYPAPGSSELTAEVDRWLAAAAAADTEEDKRLGDKRGDEMPAWVADKEKRLVKLRAAKAALEAEAKAAAARAAATPAATSTSACTSQRYRRSAKTADVSRADLGVRYRPREP